MAARKTLPAKAEAAPAVKARRPLVAEKETPAVSYFASGSDKDNMEFFSSGCAVMDEALSGGYVLGRVSNIVGDKSSGKTLKAMEAAANFLMKFPEGKVRYAETEAAFDKAYAEALGIPIDRIIFNKPGQRIATVEDWYEDMMSIMDANPNVPLLYILDSLDAISDEAEEKRDFNEGSYGGTKPKAIGKLFRMLIERIETSRMHLMIISQLRDKIGVTFGETKTRSGGKALDFYCTHIVWLAEIAKIKQTIAGIDRVTGIQVRAKVKKNKIGLCFREADYPILFGYGIDDLTSSVEWLLEVKREHLLEPLGLTKAGYKVRLRAIRNRGGDEPRELRAKLNALVRQEWAKIETTFLPTAKKY